MKINDLDVTVIHFKKCHKSDMEIEQDNIIIAYSDEMKY